ncbi:MAG: hypothetical protein HY696_00010 [Deltaproteobacteria bacterium]|nr:hypothetical protein [Deltaproteobacteria bacterium]
MQFIRSVRIILENHFYVGTCADARRRPLEAPNQGKRGHKKLADERYDQLSKEAGIVNSELTNETT